MFKPFTLRRLGGLNENEDPTSLRETELTEAHNTARLGILTGTRPGMGFDSGGAYEAQIATGPAVQGITEWSRGRDTTQEIVTVAGGNARNGPLVGDILDKTTNTVTITSGADNLWTFADHNNILYAAGGASGDSFWYWDGTNPLGKIDVQDSTATTLKPKYVFHWKNYMILGGLQPTTPVADNNPLVWRYHNLGSDPTNATNWPTSNTIGGGGIGGISGYGSEFSTGTAAFQDNNGSYLMLLTNKKIYSYVQDPNALIGFVKNDEIANGCVNQHAYVDLGMDSGDAIYMSEVGVHSLRLSQQYSGRARAFLSWPIRKTFASLNRNRFKYVTAGYWPTEGIVAFAVSVGSSSTHDLILAMDIQEAQEITPDTVRWYKWQISTEASESINFLTFGRDVNKQPVLYVGTTAGRVGKFNRDSYLDFGDSYETAFTTKHEDFGAPGVTKTVGDMNIISRGNGDYEPTHQYVFDYGDRMSPSRQNLSFDSVGGVWDTGVLGTSVFGGAQQISRQKFYGYGSGETVAHRFQHTPSASTSEPFFLASITQQVSVTGEAQPQNSEAAA